MSANNGSELLDLPADLQATLQATRLAEQVRREEHLLACEKAVALVAETYGRDWDKRERAIKSEAWHLALGDVPSDVIPQLTVEVLKARTNPFPPVPADLLALHFGEDWAEGDGGKTERVVVANPQAYQPLSPTQNELIAKGVLQAPETQTPAEPLPKPLWKSKTDTPATQSLQQRDWEPESPEEAAVFQALNEALWRFCGMTTFSISKRARYDFARYLLARFPVSQWSQELGQAQWHLWQQEQAMQEKELSEKEASL